MNLNFVPATRRPFSMEVNPIDTIQEIKQQIQERHQIPAEKQTLIFNNRILQDDHTMYIDYPEIIENSHIQLIISESTPPPPESQEPPPPPPSVTTATPSTTSWEFGSSTENSEPCDLRLLKRRRNNSQPPEIPTTATTKFYQESSLPSGMANPDTTLSDLGISLENTNQFPSLPQDMALFDKLNSAPPEIPATATAKFYQESSLPPRMANPDTTFSNLAIPVGNKFPPSLPPRMAMATLSNKITLLLNMPVIGVRRAMEFEVNDSIRRLKEKIVKQVDQLNPDGKLVLRSYGIELHDCYTLLQYGLLPHSEIDVSVKRSASPPPPSFLTTSTDINPNIPKVPKFPSSSSNPLKMDNNNGKNKNVMEPNIPKNPEKIMVLPLNGKNKVAVEVNANDNVEELRKELDKVDEDQYQNLGADDDTFEDFDIYMADDQTIKVDLEGLDVDLVDDDAFFQGLDVAFAGPSGPPPGPPPGPPVIDLEDEDVDIMSVDNALPPALNEERLRLFVALKKNRCDAVRLLGEKSVRASDLAPNKCRLQLTGEISGVLDNFLTEQESHQLSAEKKIETRMFFIKPGMRLEEQAGDFKIKLTQWTNMLVLNGAEWNGQVLSSQVLQERMLIKIWAYRVGEQLGFALTV